jgi:cytochrome P450
MDEQHTSGRDVDLDFFEHHFNPWDERNPEQVLDALPELRARCPVAHSDALGGFYVANTYEKVSEVFKDWRTYSSVKEKSLTPLRPTTPTMPPLSVDPPVQKHYRLLLNPFLTPNRVASYEPGIRRLVTSLIDGFVEDGTCEFVSQFAQEFPGRMLYEFMLGVDPAEVPLVHSWTHKYAHEPTAPDTPEAERQWVEWIYALIERRRSEPRRDDVLDALVHGTIDDEPIPDHDIMGAVMILILGGFNTTTDALASAMWRMADLPDLQEQLRRDPGTLPLALDEFLRYDPPVSMMPRLCTADTTLGEYELHAGDRVAASIIAANRDPSEFDAPDEFRIDRSPNRHLSFGIGVHRCIGSNLARLNLTVALEELIGRLSPFRRPDPGTVPPLNKGVPWGPRSLDLVFEPGRRIGR